MLQGNCFGISEGSLGGVRYLVSLRSRGGAPFRIGSSMVVGLPLGTVEVRVFAGSLWDAVNVGSRRWPRGAKGSDGVSCAWAFSTGLSDASVL